MTEMTNQEDNLRVPYALAVHGREEEEAVVNILRNNKTIIGNYTKEFEQKVSKLFGKRYGIMVNSGSSANFIAIELLKLQEGSEIITPALSFSTTIAPLLQKQLKPILVDVEEGTFIIDTDKINEKITKKTKALVIPSLLGNVPDMERLRKIADENSIKFIEDSCDTLGATFKGKPTGEYSDISTTSFYGSHIITACGGGGMLCVNNQEYEKRARVLRGWGRSSAVDESETIEKRFGVKLDGIQYDSKFIFNELGYNFLPLEVSSAFGLEQLKKLDKFAQIRHSNWSRLYKYFEKYKEYFKLPKQRSDVTTSWLAFPLVIKEGAPFSRYEIVIHLEKNNIQTRPIFTGNVLRQPAFKNLKIKNDFPIADEIMKNGFVVGCNHGLNDKHITKIEQVTTEFLSKR
jgi:CDP-6-deoxy-D-xylo-4-hexulose-3-dehydrase